MSTLQNAYARGRAAAISKFAKQMLATNPVVANSTLSNPSVPRPPVAPDVPQMTPQALATSFSSNVAVRSQTEPKRKIGAEICTTCRKQKHYGDCRKPTPIKQADFNIGMRGNHPSAGDNPTTSPHYHSATTSVNSLTRSQQGRPADEQARGQFADLFRKSRDFAVADQADRNTAALDKVSSATLDGEHRGPTVNPYNERRPSPVPSQARGHDRSARIWSAFDNINDSTAIDGNGGTPAGGPAV